MVGFDPFSFRGMRKHWSLIPVFTFCSLGGVLSGAYIAYMLGTKPDVVLNHKRLDRYDPPHNDVGPTENRKLFRFQVPKVIEEVENLRKEIYPQKHT